VTFVALLSMMRVVGQREAAGLGVTDILVIVLVAEAAAAGLHGDASSVTDGVLLVATILFWSIAFDAIAYRWPRLERVIKARPRLLIKDGAVNPQVLRRELMSRADLLAAPAAWDRGSRRGGTRLCRADRDDQHHSP
jgi:uncharacterized membrane protein YcaP (DUF421 family)